MTWAKRSPPRGAKTANGMRMGTRTPACRWRAPCWGGSAPGKEIIAYCENMCRLHMRAHVCYYVQVEAGRTNLLFDESVCPHDLALLAACDTMGKGSASGDAPKKKRF